MKRINVEQLKIEDKAREFKEKVKLSIDECESEGVELLWQSCKTTLREISEEVLGFNERQIRNEWYDGECAEATKVKNDAYQQMLQKYRTSVGIYIARRREEKYIIWKKKRDYEKQRCEEAEKLYTAKEIRQFYQNTNSIRKKFKPNSQLCKDK
jgi:hypothetical protein